MISLGEEHVAYRCLDFPLTKLSVVGGRPFSCGGEQMFRKRLLAARYVSTKETYYKIEVYYAILSHSHPSYYRGKS